MAQKKEFQKWEVQAEHGKKPNQKLKPYVVLQYLLKYSDENNLVKAPDIVNFLEEHGISAERCSIYRDIADINKIMWMMENDSTIQEAEEAIAESEEEKLIVYDKSKKGFYVRQRHYDLNDIRLLAECVYAAKFIPQGQAKRLVDVVTEFVSENQAGMIRHDALLTDRVKTNNKETLFNISIINEAMSRTLDGKRHTPEKIRFKYLKYTIQNLDRPKEERKGEWYVVSPYRLLINDGYYYLLGYDDKYRKMLTYRVDRMRKVEAIEEEREGQEAADATQINSYAQKSFSMFGGNTQVVKIRFINAMLDTVLDRFGKSGVYYDYVDENHFCVTIEVNVSDQFYAWLCGFGRRAKIVYPDSVADGFRAYLDKIRGMYEQSSSQD